MDIIAGAGQVGTALAGVMDKAGRDYLLHDPAKGHSASGFNAEVLNICFPYSDEFVQQAKDAIKKFKPGLTIIHSTVEVGTTRKVGKNVAYSFVRGRHQNDMTDMMLINTKHMGCADKESWTQAVSYLVGLGFDVDPYDNPEVVELGKLWDTTYYGICIAATKWIKSVSDFYGVKWDDIAAINRAYNEGALRYGHPEWVRPELEPTPGKIGGHCILPNVRIFQKVFSHKLLDAVVEAE